MTSARLKVVNRQTLLLSVILALALLLRLWGVGGLGLPRVGYVDDEPVLTDSALELLRQDRLDLSRWKIGNAQIYLQAALQKTILAIRGVEPTEVPTYREIMSAQKISASVIGVPYPLPEFYYWGRVTVAILGGLSVVILFFIGQTVKSSRVGLMSAFFLAANSLHIEYSHYLLRTVPGAFVLLLALYAILLAYQKQKWFLYLLSFGLVYLAVYTKQNNLILLAPLGLALTMSVWREFQQRSIQEMARYGGLIFSVVALIFLLSRVFFQFNVFAYGRGIFNRIFYNDYVYGGYHFGFSGDDTPRWLIEQVFVAPSANWRLIALLAIPGVVLANQLKGRGWLCLIVLVPYWLMLSLFTVRFVHWLMPVVPLLALLAALTLDRVYERFSQHTTIDGRYLPAIFSLLVILISGASIRAAVALDYYAGRPDIRNVASEWIQKELPQGSKIVVDSWGPYLEATGHEIIYVYQIGDKDLQAYRDEQVDYLVLNSINLSRLISAGADPRAAEIVELRTNRLKQIMEELPLEREFVGPALFNPPVVNVFIYELR